MNRLIIVFLVLLVSCNTEQPKPLKLTGEAQGTYYSIIYYDEAKRNFQPEIDSILKDFDQSVSLWVPNSIISRVNKNDTSVLLDTYFMELLKLSVSVAEHTGGAFDFTVAPLVSAWGFGFDASKKVDSLIIDSILQFVGHENVSIDSGWLYKSDERISIDFNAIAQGYSVDLIGQYLEKRNITDYIVDIGGEVKAKGQKPDGSPWKVGVEQPAEDKHAERHLKAILEVTNRSVATSGSYRKFYEENGVRYSHTINPVTGYPVKHSLLSVSVVADHTAIADAYATAFLVMGLERSIEFLERSETLEAYFIYTDRNGEYKTYATDGFKSLISSVYE